MIPQSVSSRSQSNVSDTDFMMGGRYMVAALVYTDACLSFVCSLPLVVQLPT